VERDIRLENIGPIRELTIPLPEEGGVVVLGGRNGAGKSHALAATQALLRGDGRVPCRDGAPRGTVDGLGAQISVSRRTRRKGELTVDHIEGRLSVGEIIDPGVNDPAAADAKRIRAIVQVTGVKADPTRFHGLLGGVERFTSIVSDDALATDDLVEMALRVKRAIEARARTESKEAERLDGLAEGLEVAAGDEGYAVDPEEAQQELEAALAAKAKLDERGRIAIDATEARVKADESLAAMGPRVDVVAAEKAFQESEDAMAEDAAEVERIEAVLADAKTAAAASMLAHREARSAMTVARREDKLRSELRAVLDGDAPDAPSENDIADAEARIVAARERIAQAALSEKAEAQRGEARRHRASANATRSREAELRDAAAGVDDVLSIAVACDRLKVYGGRLVVETERGTTPYAELSHGERARIAVDIAADRVGEGGLIALDQEVWEGFDPDNREAIAAHARERGVVILTAEATGGDLAAETFEGDDDAAV